MKRKQKERKGKKYFLLFNSQENKEKEEIKINFKK